MARAGISEYHVFQAAERLTALGSNPTVDSVRRELGDTGSRTTINNHLRTWRDQRQHQPLSTADLSASLQTLLGEQAKSLLLALEKEAEAKFSGQQERYELAMQQQRDAQEQLKTRLQDSERLMSELQKGLETHRQEIAALQVRLTEAQDDNQGLRENRAALQTSVTHLHQQQQALVEQTRQTEKAHEKALHDRTQSLEGLREKLAAERQTNMIQAARLHDLEKQIPAMQAEFKKANAESMRVRNEAHAAVQQVKDERQQTVADAEVLKRRLADRDQEIVELKRELIELRTQGHQQIANLATVMAEFGNNLKGGKHLAPEKAPLKRNVKKTT